MIRIDCIKSKKDRRLLDTMWGLKSLDELDEWKRTLKPKTKKRAQVLEKMIVYACLDALVTESDDCGDADEIIRTIMEK